MHSAFWQERFIPKTVEKMITNLCPVKVSEGNATAPLPAAVEIQAVKPNPERGSFGVNQI